MEFLVNKADILKEISFCCLKMDRSTRKTRRHNPKKTLKIVSFVERRYCDTSEVWYGIYHIAPYYNAKAFIKKILEKSKEI